LGGLRIAVRWASARLEELDVAVAEVVPHEPVALNGQWAVSKRRTYQSAGSRPGVGPFVDVLDMTWTGSFVGPNPIVAIAFLATAAGVYWAKSGPAKLDQPVRLSLHAYADYSPTSATLGASVGGAFLPAVPVAYAGSPADACVITADPLVTGRVLVLATSDRAEVLVALVQAALVRTGRNRLWRLRDDYASALPARARELLTRRRTGSISVTGVQAEQ
jgi:hypothetical protein